MATLGVGTEVLRRAKEKAESDPFKGAMHVIDSELGSARKYYAIFQLPRECFIDFSAGDKGTVRFEEVRGGHWDMLVIEPVPGSGKNAVTVCLEPGEGVSVGKTLPVTPNPRHRPVKEMFAKPGLNATVCPEDRHNEFPYIMEAFDQLQDRFRSAATGSLDAAVRNFLVGNDLRSLPKFDIYAPLANKNLAAEDTMNLNDSQKSAIRMSRSAPAGFVVCHGGVSLVSSLRAQPLLSSIIPNDTYLRSDMLTTVLAWHREDPFCR